MVFRASRPLNEKRRAAVNRVAASMRITDPAITVLTERPYRASGRATLALTAAALLFALGVVALGLSLMRRVGPHPRRAGRRLRRRLPRPRRRRGRAVPDRRHGGRPRRHPPCRGGDGAGALGTRRRRHRIAARSHGRGATSCERRMTGAAEKPTHASKGGSVNPAWAGRGPHSQMISRSNTMESGQLLFRARRLRNRPPGSGQDPPAERQP